MLCDINFELLPSVFRTNKTNGKTFDEKTIYLVFMQYAPDNNLTYDFIRDSDKVLAEMQHYGTYTTQLILLLLFILPVLKVKMMVKYIFLTHVLIIKK